MFYNTDLSGYLISKRQGPLHTPANQKGRQGKEEEKVGEREREPSPNINGFSLPSAAAAAAAAAACLANGGKDGCTA
jgi:hypothetical protein